MNKKPNNDDQCPKCGSDEIDGQSIETGGNCASQECFCIACGANWINQYRYVKSAILNERGKS